MIVRLKAHGGDRAKNLEGIADAFESFLKGGHDAAKTVHETKHRLIGYCEQLRIIADELREAKSGETKSKA